MKILKLRFQNLNSLEGEWQIDFSHPAYQSTNIFAITGPTGSGKTTILDAICLALYGRTPRLKNISKSANEILTRQTGFCFSEITFETLKGRFRCHWSQHRARKKPQGDLQQPRHEIVDNSTSKVLENKIKDVAILVEEVTGMTFDQFTRSILLAQGSFAAFLLAPSDERAPILEQITGTEIYSNISKKVHERNSNEETVFRTMTLDIESTAVLSEIEEEKLHLHMAEEQSEAETIQKRLLEIQKVLIWLKTISTLESEVIAGKEGELKINQLLAEEEPNRQLLERARAASSLNPQYHSLVLLRETQVQELKDLFKKTAQQDSLDQAVLHLTREYLEAGEKLRDAEKKLQEELLTGRTIREKDFKIKEIKAQHAELKKLSQNIAEQKNSENSTKISLKNVIRKKQKALEKCKNYLKSRAVDEDLIESLAALKEKFFQLQTLSQKSDLLLEQMEKTNGLLQQSTEHHRELEKQHSLLKNIHDEQEKKLGELAEESRKLNTEYPDPGKGIEKFGNRIHLLEKLKNLLELKEEFKEASQQATKNLDNLNRSLEKKGIEERNIVEKVICQKEIIQKQEEIVLLSNRISSYEEERSHLQDGSPCPLCGAIEHPFGIKAPQPEANSIAVLEQEKDNLVNLQEQLLSLKTDISITRTQLEDTTQKRISLGQKLDDNTTTIEELHQTLGLQDQEIIPAEISQLLTESRIVLRQFQAAAHKKDQLNLKITGIRNEIDLEKDKVIRAEQLLQREHFKQRSLRDKVEELTHQQREVQESISINISALTIAISPFGFSDIDRHSCTDILEILTARQQTWKEQSTQGATLSEEMRIAESELERAKLLFAKLAEDFAIKQEETVQKLTELEALVKDRQTIYGSKNPEDEEKRCELERSRAAALLKKKEEERLEKNNTLVVLKEQCRALKNSTTTRKTELKNVEASFFTLLDRNNFPNEEMFTRAQLPEEEGIRIESHLNDLQEQQQKTITLLAEKKRQLSIEKEKSLASEKREVLEDELAVKNELFSKKQQEIGKIQSRLQENLRLLDQQKEKRQALARQKKEMQRWQKLDKLIGSANGKKFRNFAQGITFEIMVKHANRNLQKMSDRYILVRDKVSPLELNVIDNYRGGDIRSTKNLSGGESFLVSLALALGLSNMASKNIRVDSLFLDEGFGTLDEETLETALQTLASLQQEGKIIGIISHIALLQERLDTKIQVIPGLGGHSRLTGPGIKAL